MIINGRGFERFVNGGLFEITHRLATNGSADDQAGRVLFCSCGRDHKTIVLEYVIRYCGIDVDLPCVTAVGPVADLCLGIPGVDPIGINPLVLNLVALEQVRCAYIVFLRPVHFVTGLAAAGGVEPTGKGVLGVTGCFAGTVDGEVRSFICQAASQQIIAPGDVVRLVQNFQYFTGNAIAQQERILRNYGFIRL